MFNFTSFFVEGTTTERSTHALKVWGFPPTSKLIDSVPQEMIGHIHPHWNSFQPVNPMWHNLLGVIYIFLGLISLIGNLLVIYLFIKSKRLRNPANSLVINLAFSDLGMMLSQFPIFIWNTFNGGVWSFGPLACQIYAATGSAFGMCSICTMAAIAYDRYNVIAKGVQSVRLTTGKSILWILFCWIYAIGWSIPPFFNWGSYIPDGVLDFCSYDYLSGNLSTVTYTFTMFAVNYCIPLLIILFCYFHIVRAVSLREQNLRRQVDKMDAVSLRTDSAANASNMDIHFAKVNLINVTMWVALWTPYVVVVLHGALGQRDMITPLVSTLTFLTARCIAVVNPIVYAFSHTKYRLALQEALPWFCINETEPMEMDEAEVETVLDNKSTNSIECITIETA